MTEEERTQDWLGERFAQYSARVRSLRTGDRVMRRKEWPIRPLNWTATPSLGGPLASLLVDRRYNVRSSLDPNILRIWCHYSNNVKPLFPNLTELRWVVRDDGDEDLISLFLVPSLTSICLLPTFDRDQLEGTFDPSDSTSTVNLLRKILTCCPSLTSIDLRGDQMNVPALDTLIGSQLQHLKDFRCTVPVPNEFVRYAATLPHLENFQVTVQPELVLDDLPHIFPALCELHISCATIFDTTKLLVSVQSSFIHTLEVQVNHLVSRAEHIEELLRAIADHASALSLRCLVLKRGLIFEPSLPLIDLNGIEDMHTLVLGLPMIKPILILSQLQQLRLNAFPFDWSSPVIGRMLAAWPALTILELPGEEEMTLREFIDSTRQHRHFLEALPVKVLCQLGDPISPNLPDTQYPLLEEVSIAIISGPHEDVHIQRIVPLAHYLTTAFPILPLHKIWGDEAITQLVHYARLVKSPGVAWTLDEYRNFAASPQAYGNALNSSSGGGGSRRKMIGSTERLGSERKQASHSSSRIFSTPKLSTKWSFLCLGNRR